jgi:hypothetical protein
VCLQPVDRSRPLKSVLQHQDEFRIGQVQEKLCLGPAGFWICGTTLSEGQLMAYERTVLLNPVLVDRSSVVELRPRSSRSLGSKNLFAGSTFAGSMLVRFWQSCADQPFHWKRDSALSGAKAFVIGIRNGQNLRVPVVCVALERFIFEVKEKLSTARITAETRNALRPGSLDCMTRRWTPESPITFLLYTRINWAGDRALLGSNSSIYPGAGMAGAAVRPRSQASHSGPNALNPGGLEAEPPVQLRFRFGGGR